MRDAGRIAIVRLIACLTYKYFCNDLWSRFSIPQSCKATAIESKEPIVCKFLTDIEYESSNGEIEDVTYELYEKKIGEESLSVFAVDTDTEEEPQGNTQSLSDNQTAEIDDKMDSAFPDSNKNVSREFSPINRSRHIGAAMLKMLN